MSMTIHAFILCIFCLFKINCVQNKEKKRKKEKFHNNLLNNLLIHLKRDIEIKLF